MKNEAIDPAVPDRARAVASPETQEIAVPRETLLAVPTPPVSVTNRQACLVHIYPTGPGMGTRYTLADSRVVLGRDSDCDICLGDLSVSRHHARTQPGLDGYYVVDL